MDSYVRTVFSGEIDIISKLKLPVIERQEGGAFIFKGGKGQTNEQIQVREVPQMQYKQIEAVMALVKEQKDEGFKLTLPIKIKYQPEACA